MQEDTGTERNASAARWNRTERLVGAAGMQRLAAGRVILFGVGGVGSWCAESLVRTGLGHVTLVDSDRVCATNMNRQLQATHSTIGRVKVEALRERLRDIAPRCQIEALHAVYNASTADQYDFNAYDVVVDAIDSVSSKVLLLYRASQSRAAVFSSLGAALKLDPARVRVGPFMQVQGCPLGRVLRKKMRRDGCVPAKSILAVYSDELLENVAAHSLGVVGESVGPQISAAEAQQPSGNARKAVVNGTVAHMTGIFGLTLAGLVVQHLLHGSSAP